MTTEIEDLIREYGHRFINEQNALATADLAKALGDRLDDTEYIQSLGYEVVWQYSPDGPPHEFYRGLQQHGAWIVDHHPDWPQPASMHEGSADA